MNKIIITESQYARLNEILTEEILTEALHNIQELIKEYPNAENFLIKTKKGVKQYEITENNSGKLIINMNDSSPFFHFTGFLNEVKIGGDNVYIIYKFNDVYDRINKTEILNQVVGFQLKDGNNKTLFPVPKNTIISKTNKNIIKKDNKPEPKHEPELEKKPEHEPEPEEQPDQEPVTGNTENRQEGIDVYNYIINDPTIRKAFYNQPKLLGLIRMGDPVGIVPAEELIKTFNRNRYGKSKLFEMFPVDTVCSIIPLEDITVESKDFSLVKGVNYENLKVVDSGLLQEYVTLISEATDENPKFKVLVYDFSKTHKVNFDAKVQLIDEEGYSTEPSPMSKIKIIKQNT